MVNQNPEVFLGVYVLDEPGLGVVTQPGIDHDQAVALLRPPPTAAELELSSCPQHRREFEALQSEVTRHLRGSEAISIPFAITPDYKTCQVNLQGEFSNVETADLLDKFGPMLRFTIRPGPVGGTFGQ